MNISSNTPGNVDEDWAYGLSEIEPQVQRLFDGIPHNRRAEFADDLMLWARHQSDDAILRSVQTLSAKRYSKTTVMETLHISKTRLERLLGQKQIPFDPKPRSVPVPEDAIDISHLLRSPKP